MDLYVSVLKLLLVEELYPATAAGFNHYIITSEKGVVVSVDGFNEKLPVSARRSCDRAKCQILAAMPNAPLTLQLLLMTIMKYMADYPNLIRRELFDVMKEQQIKDYYNMFLKPGKLVKYFTHFTIRIVSRSRGNREIFEIIIEIPKLTVSKH